jgi:hypothetical protein
MSSSWAEDIGLNNQDVIRLVRNLNEAFSPTARTTRSDNSSEAKVDEKNKTGKTAELIELQKLNTEIAKQYTYSVQRDPVMVALLSTSLSILETSLGNVVDNISSLLSVSIEENEKNVKRFNDQLATFIEMNTSLRNLVDHFNVSDEIRKNNQTNAENWYANVSEKLLTKISLPSADSSSYLFKHLDDLSKSLGYIAESLKPKNEDTLTPDKKEKLPDWKQIISDLGKEFVNFTSNMMVFLKDTLIGFFSNLEIVKNAKSAAGGLLNTIIDIGAIATIATLFGGSIMKAIGVIDESAGTNISEVISSLVEPLKKYRGWIQTLFKQTVLFKSSLSQLPQIFESLTKIPELIYNFVKGTLKFISNSWRLAKNPALAARVGRMAVAGSNVGKAITSKTSVDMVGKVASVAGAAVKDGAIGITKIVPKLLNFLKKVPLLGTLISIGFAVKKFSEGDTRGGVLSLASGLAGLIPYAGWALSFMIDAYDAKLTEEAGGDIDAKNAGYGFMTFLSDIGTAIYNGVKWILKKALKLVGLDSWVSSWDKEEKPKNTLKPPVSKTESEKNGTLPTSAPASKTESEKNGTLPTSAPATKTEPVKNGTLPTLETKPPTPSSIITVPALTQALTPARMQGMSDSGTEILNSMSSQFKTMIGSFQQSFDKLGQMSIGNVVNQSVVNNSAHSGPIPVSSRPNTIGEYRGEIARKL